jgi:hypothetical protein
MPLSGCARRLCALGRRGVTSLEFAVTASLTVTLIFGSAEAAKYSFTLQSLRAAAGEAARSVMLRGGANMSAGVPACQGLSGALPGATARVRYLDATKVTATLAGCATNGGVSSVNVTLLYPYTFSIPIFGRRSETLSENAQAVFN